MRYTHSCLPITCCVTILSMSLFPWTTTHAVSTFDEFDISRLSDLCIPCVHWKVVVLLKWQPAFQSTIWTPQFNLSISVKWKKKKWALWRKVDVKNIFSNTNALNQAGPTLQAMVLTGKPVGLNLWLVPFANVISFIYLATHGEISLLKLQQQKSVTFSVIKNSVLTFLSEQEKVSDTNFLSIANGSWYQSQLGKPMAVPVPFHWP